MKKLNKILYNKMLLQAHEAKDQGFTKLADDILQAIGDAPRNEKIEYSYGQLQEDIHSNMWKLASDLMVYYDVESADVEKIDEIIAIQASSLIDALEEYLEKDTLVKGPLEPKVPGEK